MEPVSGPGVGDGDGDAGGRGGLRRRPSRLFLLAAGGDAERERDGEGELGGTVHRKFSWWNGGPPFAGRAEGEGRNYGNGDVFANTSPK